MPKISVVILCYKAGNAVPDFASRVRATAEKLTQDWEIVLVGNYHANDADITPEVVRSFAQTDPRFKAITLEKKGMMGWDARCGLNAATGDTVAIIDGDNQMPPEDIELVYNVLINKNLDMVMTYRSDRKDSLGRRLNSKIFNFIFNILFPGYPVRDVNSKPKIFTKSLLNKFDLTSNDWFLDTEIMIQARRHKARIEQIPTTFYRSMERKSFVRPEAIFEFLVNLTKSRLREFFYKK